MHPAGSALPLTGLDRARARRPRLGASSKHAMERMAAGHRKKDLRSGHLLPGVLQAEVGTVPRALALAGVDRAELIEKVRSAL